MLQTKEFYEMAKVGYVQVANKALAEIASLDTLIAMMERPTGRATAVPANLAVALNKPRRGRPPLVKVVEPTERAPANYQQPKRHRKLSASARRAISRAQKARHQKAREEKAAAVVSIGKRGRKRAA